jgi:DNA repair exonuclease SbcCD ATPase subunit
MKIQELTLKPFAGTQDRTVSFRNGLNVVLGKNEAGKSTLLNALRCLLFVPVKLTDTQFNKQLGSYVPLGGDTLSVSADIDLDGEPVKLEKSWGGSKDARMVLPDGQTIKDMTRIQAEILNRLGFPESVYNEVILTRQNQLASTIENLEENKENAQSLADLLRKNSYEMDGVSVTALKDETDVKVSVYFGRWDIDRNAPESNKMDWIKGVGHVVKAYYELRQSETILQRAEEFESNLDALNSRFDRVNAELSEKSAFVKENERFVKDLDERLLLEMKLKQAEEKSAVITRISAEWPVELNKLHTGRTQSAEKQAQLAQVKQGINLWRAYNSKSEEVRKLERIREMHTELQSLEKEFAALPKIGKQDIDQLTAVSNTIQRQQAILDAQKLRVAVQPNKDFSLKITSGADSAKEVEFREEQLEILEASGRMRIEHEDFTLTISGANDVRSVMQEIAHYKQQYQQLLGRWGVENPQELMQQRMQFENKERNLLNARRQLNQALNGRTLEQWEQEAQGIKKPELSESLDVLESRLGTLSDEIASLNATIGQADNQIGRWSAEYGNPEQLMDALVTLKAEAIEIRKQLEKLQPLPGHITDSEAFKRDFRLAKERADELKDKLNDIIRQRAQLEKESPDESAEELREQVITARRHFEKTLETGKAFLRIQQELETLLGELDTHTFTPLRDATERYFNDLTGGKYTHLLMDEMTPAGVKLKDKNLPANLLSAGTLDLLALATRLAMADVYLGNTDSCIILDDPMVNLDPERQKLAAECLRKLGRRRQVIVLTCHQHHADLLQGDLIEL